MSACAFACAANSSGGGYLRSSSSSVSIACSAHRNVQLVRAVGQALVAVLGHEQQILDPNAAEALLVDPRLDRDDVARDELLADHPERRRLVHLEPDPVPERVVEAVLEHLALALRQLRRVAVLGDELGGQPVELAAVDAGAHVGDGQLERLPAERVPLADLAGHLPHDERPRQVRVARRLEVDGEQVEDEDVVRADRARAHVVADRRLRAVGDDHLLGQRAVARGTSPGCAPSGART